MSTVGNKDEKIVDAGGDDQQQLGGGGNGGDASGSQELSTSTPNNEDSTSNQVDEKSVSTKLEQSAQSDDVAATDPVPPTKPKRKTKGSAEQVPKQEEPQAETETVVLGPWDLKITNHGSETSCMVTRKSIPRGVATVLQYASLNEKHLAMGNFAQINALAGYKRFTFED